MRFSSVIHVCCVCLAICFATYSLAESVSGESSIASNAQSGVTLPIFAAHLSESLQQECEQHACDTHVFNVEQINAALGSLYTIDELEQALSLSQYEVLVSNVVISKQTAKQKELVVEISTSWRQVPIDELVLRTVVEDDLSLEELTSLLEKWVSHIEQEQILEARRIYDVLNASDYASELNLPTSIGEFTLSESALYRDPLQGSISRYAHPEYADAVLDISVYPFSPFDKSSEQLSAQDRLMREMTKEVEQINALVEQANITDFSISEIVATTQQFNGVSYTGLRVEVLLNAKTDPVYSTQYLFYQNDKIIKLTANVPDFLMSNLVDLSIASIKVPQESAFMKSLRRI